VSWARRVRFLGGPNAGKLADVETNEDGFAKPIEMFAASPWGPDTGSAGVKIGEYVVDPKNPAIMRFQPLRQGETGLVTEEDVELSFVRLVKDMREAQLQYFKNRDRDVLVRSKALEKEVDARVAWLIRSGGG